MKAKFTILDITDWWEDAQMEAGDSCHMGEGDVMRLKLKEYEDKIEGGKWPGLPFTCLAENADEAIQKYNDKFCDYDYYKAVDADFSDEEEKEE